MDADFSGPTRILVVDRDEAVAGEIVDHVTRAGFAAVASPTGPAACEALRDADADIVVLPVGLATDELRVLGTLADELGLAIVCSAESLDPTDARIAMRLGARDVLLPPFIDAADRLREVLDFSRPNTNAEQELRSLRSQHAALERRFLEQMLALEESQESFYLDLSRMMTIISNIMDGIVFADCDANITLMNPVAEDLLGVKSFMALGRSVEEIPGDGDLVDALREDFEAQSSGQRRDSSRTIEVHHSEQDLLYIKVQTSQVTDYRGCSAGVLCVMQDVTAEYKTDQLKNQYLSIVAHELRTPLTGIKTFSTMMAKGALGDLSDSQQRVMDSIREQSLRLEHQIDKLINLGHLESNEVYGQDLEKFGMHELVQQASAPFELAADDRQIQFSVRMLGEDQAIDGDKSDLRRAIQAVVENAIKFTPDGGEVSIEVSEDRDAFDGAGGMKFSVRDTGPGIDPRYQRRIFEKFFQVEDPLTRHHGGAGLGLFFARGILNAHGSEISVESQLGGGSHFCFVLPIADEGVGEIAAAATNTDLVHTESE